jgi:hypothetical protein
LGKAKNDGLYRAAIMHILVGVFANQVLDAQYISLRLEPDEAIQDADHASINLLLTLNMVC